MLLVQRNPVGRFIAAICLGAKFPTDGNLRGKSHHAHPDFVADQSTYRLVDISGVGGKQGSKYYEYFPGTMTGGMAISIGEFSEVRAGQDVNTYKRAPRAISNPF